MHMLPSLRKCTISSGATDTERQELAQLNEKLGSLNVGLLL